MSKKIETEPVSPAIPGSFDRIVVLLGSEYHRASENMKSYRRENSPSRQYWIGRKAMAVLIADELGVKLSDELKQHNGKVSDGGPVASDCNSDAIPPFAAPPC